MPTGPPPLPIPPGSNPEKPPRCLPPPLPWQREIERAKESPNQRPSFNRPPLNRSALTGIVGIGLAVVGLAAVGILLLLALLAFHPPGSQEDSFSRGAPSERPLTGEQIYRQLVPSTAFVVTQDGVGSGVLIDARRRLVLTNSHVVSHGAPSVVFFPDFGSSAASEPILHPRHYLEQATTLGLRGTVLADSPQRDLALIQLDRLPAHVPALPVASEPAPIGSMLYSIGASGIELGPNSVDGTLWRLSSGEARGRNRWSHVFPNQTVNAVFLETQKPINPGDSGGPTVNDRCQLVGIVSSMDLTRDAVRRDVDLSEVLAFLREVEQGVAAAKRFPPESLSSLDHHVVFDSPGSRFEEPPSFRQPTPHRIGSVHLAEVHTVPIIRHAPSGNRLERSRSHIDPVRFHLSL